MKDTTRQADVTIGLDLGDRRCEACVLDAAGEVVERRSVATVGSGNSGRPIPEKVAGWASIDGSMCRVL